MKHNTESVLAMRDRNKFIEQETTLGVVGEGRLQSIGGAVWRGRVLHAHPVDHSQLVRWK